MRVVNRRTYKQAAGERSVYIGRPSVLGNPFVIGRNGSRQNVIQLYREWLHFAAKHDDRVQEALRDLRGADVLVCWCAPLTCHGDVLIELLEEGETA